MEKVDELKNTPLGYLVKIGRSYYAAIEFLPQGNTKGNVCAGCAFRDDGGVEECRFSSACMAHKRPDHESVIFIKIDRP